MLSSPSSLPRAVDVHGAEEEIHACWTRWREAGDTVARDRLVLHYLPYARMMAATLYGRRTHDDVEFDDYLQLARVGLLEAVERFDPEQGVQFRTFASKRVHGAVLNGLVRLTEKNQQISVGLRLRQERMEATKQAAAEAAQDGTKGDSVGPRSPGTLFRYLAEVGIGLALGILLEDTGMVDTDAFVEPHAPSPEVSYFRKTEMRQLSTLLRGLVGRLPEQQKQVIGYHYIQEIPFDEIAATMGVTRGRISQLHRQGLLKLRKLLDGDSRVDVSW